jgi:hypothetical protein
MIVRIDDMSKPEELDEVWHRPLPQVSLEGLEAAHYLDGLEEQVTEVGWALMRQLIVEQWRLTDRALVRAYQERHREAATREDGYDELQAVSRFGVIQLPRQVCYNAEADCHVLPGNTALPPHNGQVATRGLQEGVCLLPQDVPFATAQWLLGWLTREVEVISTTQVRRWVQQHGQLIRQAEQVEVQALLEHASLSDWQACLAPLQAPRRPAAWDQSVNEAVEHALAQPDQPPPTGGSAGDWERVLSAPRRDRDRAPAALGSPALARRIVAATSDVGIRRPPKNGAGLRYAPPVCAPPPATAI